MDPNQVAQLLQGGGAGGAPPPTMPTPQQILAIQNLMKNPGGLGAMQNPTDQMMQSMAQQPGMMQGGPFNQPAQMPPANQLMQQLNATSPSPPG